MDLTPESKYPAEKEDIDTIIAGKDGKDYVVDVVGGVKKWVPYLPEDNHVIIEEHLPEPEKPVETGPKLNRYQIFLKDMTEKLKILEPKLPPGERIKKIQKMWKEQQK